MLLGGNLHIMGTNCYQLIAIKQQKYSAFFVMS